MISAPAWLLATTVWTISAPGWVIVTAVLLLPLVLLMIAVLVLAVASLVVPSRRQRHLLAVLDRLEKIARALCRSGKSSVSSRQHG
jgi:Flp pilus assembly protein TadB